MSTEGLPSPDPAAPDAKLGPAQAALRAARPRPARYNGRMAALLAGGAAIVVVAAIFIPPMLAKGARPKTAAHATAVSAPSALPIEAVSYGSAPADPGAGSGGLDCSQYPGMPGCAEKNAAAASPSAPTAVAPADAAATPADPASAIQSAPSARLGQPPAPGASPGGGFGASGVFFGGQAPASPPPVSQAGPAAATARPPVLLPPAPAFPPPNRDAAPSEVMAQNGQAEKAAFVRSAPSQDYVEAKLQKPRSPYEIKAGTVIPAALLTAINSDLPGEVIAQVTEPVYDHVTGRYVLIPQGARLIGRYDAQVAYGQTRALVVWRRVIFPNGNSLDFGGMAAADPTGAAGLSDRVNDHFGQLAKGIVLSTLLSMGVSSAQDAQARSSGTLVLNSGASGLANEAESVGSRLTNRDLNRQPTIEIRQGAQVRVLIDRDMILEPYN
jgi:type IV secretory pathway VirB10-like protein